MKRVDRVYVAVHRGDFRLARICVASIRYWYPELPIYLIKDEVNGPFSTRELEELWNVRVWNTEQRVFGWGFAKLEPLFDPHPCRYLILDADIVLIGRVVDALERFDQDFVVQEESQPESAILPLYFNPAGIRAKLDAQFSGPAFTFNSGQYVATSGRLKRDDFAGLVEWSQPRRVLLPDIFNPSDQGVLNYVVVRRLAAGTISVARTPFMKWSAEELRAIDLSRLDQRSPYPYVIHWAGRKAARLGDMLRADILRHFEARYYAALPFGSLRCRIRVAGEVLYRLWTRISRRARRLQEGTRRQTES